MKLTAHDLAADGEYLSSGVVGFRVAGGRVVWEYAQYLERGRYEKVRIGRLDTSRGLRALYRWVDPDVEVELVSQES